MGNMGIVMAYDMQQRLPAGLEQGTLQVHDTLPGSSLFQIL